MNMGAGVRTNRQKGVKGASRDRRSANLLGLLAADLFAVGAGGERFI